ncbi:MAG: hypothetical protein FJ087_19600 [Deltaproteobacteria bacterium]|nr:hypothetical protein [Deltaproteobacteria bacterium]
MMTFVAILAVLGCALWLNSDLKKRRLPKGWSFPLSVALPGLVCILGAWGAGLLVGWIPIIADLTPLAGATLAILFTGGFARPLSKQLKSRV